MLIVVSNYSNACPPSRTESARTDKRWAAFAVRAVAACGVRGPHYAVLMTEVDKTIKRFRNLSGKVVVDRGGVGKGVTYPCLHLRPHTTNRPRRVHKAWYVGRGLRKVTRTFVGSHHATTVHTRRYSKQELFVQATPPPPSCPSPPTSGHAVVAATAAQSRAVPNKKKKTSEQMNEMPHETSPLCPSVN